VDEEEELTGTERKRRRKREGVQCLQVGDVAPGCRKSAVTVCLRDIPEIRNKRRGGQWTEGEGEGEGDGRRRRYSTSRDVKFARVSRMKPEALNPLGSDLRREEVKRNGVSYR